MPTSPTAPQEVSSARRTKNTTTVQRQRIIADLMRLASDGVLANGAVRAVAAINGIHPSTVSRLWRRAKEEAELTGLYVAISRMNLTGRPTVDRSEELEQLRGVPVAARSTVRSAASACGVPPTTLQRRIRAGHLRNVTSVVKPLLTEANRQARLLFCADHVDAATLLFSDMLNMVHVDEKIFYVTQPTRRYLLLPGEVAPTRRVKSKRYITRVMVLAAVARPRFDGQTQQRFDGKLGVWAFAELVPAKRSSRRRPAGTLETKEISVTKATYREMLVTHVLPAICARWPDNSESIAIQQDNAPAHIPPSDAAFVEASARCGRSVELRCQPPNSPDLNVLDLGLFTAIQARQRLKSPQTIDDLIESITESYWELPPQTMNAAFLSLQDSMDQCIVQRGDNDFKPRHMKKAQLEREGRLPLSIRCSDEAAEYVSKASVV